MFSHSSRTLNQEDSTLLKATESCAVLLNWRTKFFADAFGSGSVCLCDAGARTGFSFQAQGSHTSLASSSACHVLFIVHVYMNIISLRKPRLDLCQSIWRCLHFPFCPHHTLNCSYSLCFFSLVHSKVFHGIKLLALDLRSHTVNTQYMLISESV